MLCGCEGSKNLIVKNASAYEVFNRMVLICSSEGYTPYYSSPAEGVMKYNMYIYQPSSGFPYESAGPFDNEYGYRMARTPFDSDFTISQAGKDVLVKAHWSAALTTSIGFPYESILKKMKKNYDVVIQ